MRIDTEKHAAMVRRNEGNYAISRDLARQFDEARQILGRLKNRHVDIRNGGLKEDTPQSTINQIEMAQAECDRLMKLRDEASAEGRRYGESIAGVLQWAEDRLRQPGRGNPTISIGDGR